jgi:hypothetical protein
MEVDFGQLNPEDSPKEHLLKLQAINEDSLWIGQVPCAIVTGEMTIQEVIEETGLIVDKVVKTFFKCFQ